MGVLYFRKTRVSQRQKTILLRNGGDLDDAFIRSEWSWRVEIKMNGQRWFGRLFSSTLGGLSLPINVGFWKAYSSLNEV